MQGQGGGVEHALEVDLDDGVIGLLELAVAVELVFEQRGAGRDAWGGLVEF